MHFCWNSNKNYEKLSPSNKARVELILWAVTKEDPARALRDYLKVLESQQFQLSKEFV